LYEAFSDIDISESHNEPCIQLNLFDI
jgi:hypothetical protein